MAAPALRLVGIWHPAPRPSNEGGPAAPGRRDAGVCAAISTSQLHRPAIRRPKPRREKVGRTQLGCGAHTHPPRRRMAGTVGIRYPHGAKLPGDQGIEPWFGAQPTPKVKRCSASPATRVSVKAWPAHVTRPGSKRFRGIVRPSPTVHFSEGIRGEEAGGQQSFFTEPSRVGGVTYPSRVETGPNKPPTGWLYLIFFFPPPLREKRRL